jgi:hypothetical protein
MDINPFLKSLMNKGVEHVILHHDGVFQLIGLITVLVAMMRYKILLVICVLSSASIYTCGFVFNHCVYYNMDAFFIKLVSDGTCVAIQTQSGSEKHSYYQCDYRVNNEEFYKRIV